MAQLKEIVEGNRNSDRVQDLFDLVELGKRYLAELKAIKFKMALLEEAAELAVKLEMELSKTRTSGHYVEAKDIRNRAFTYLYQAVNEIREFGKFVFTKNKDRLKEYASPYRRELNKKSGDEEEDPEVESESNAS